jgi:hypothetical protein
MKVPKCSYCIEVGFWFLTFSYKRSDNLYKTAIGMYNKYCNVVIYFLPFNHELTSKYNSESLGFWALPIFRNSKKNRKHNVLETRPLSVLR